MKLSLLVIAMVSLALQIANAETLWRQYGFDSAHTSFNSSETALSPLTVGRLALFWRSDPFKAIATSPTLGAGVVFVASDGRVRAFDKQTGALAGTRETIPVGSFNIGDFTPWISID